MQTGGPRAPSVPLRRLSPALGALALAGCVSYRPQPLEPLAILRELEQVTVPSAPDTAGAGATGAALTARQAAAWALHHNPGLAAARAELAVADAELEGAGTLADPELGFDGMDALAVEITGGTPHAPDYLSGLGLTWQVPRPGEVGARVGIAQARRQATAARVAGFEWRLVRDVHDAFLGVVAARARLDLDAQVLAIARRTADFFRAAREVGGATAIQESLAAIAVDSLEQEKVRLDGELVAARQRLNRLLGLPPDHEIELRSHNDPLAVVAEATEAAPLVERAVRQRPDLRRQLARYRAAEQQLRLEIARQWPQVWIGTALSLVLPVASRFNRPAVLAAIARRRRAGEQVKATIHTVRAEVHAAATDLSNALRQVRAFELTLVPRVEDSLRLTDQAFRAREVTLVEILTAQRQVLDARRTYLEARIRAARARVDLDASTGDVLADALAAAEEKKP